MKIIQITILIFTLNMFSQTTKDLYITYNDGNFKNRVVSANDKNITIEVYNFEIQTENINKFILGFDKAGTLKVQHLILGILLPTFKFTYLNNNGDNPEKSITKDEMKNILEFDDIKKLTNYTNFYNTLNKFENIFLVYIKSGSSKLKAKKIKFEAVPQL